MNDVVISVERLSKRYRLGQIGASSLNEQVQLWWHRLRGRDPERFMGVVDERTHVGRRPAAEPAADDDRSAGGGRAGAIWALHDVSFEVRRGEVLGIIGRNGAGKSTLLKLLTRITEPTSGRARLRGRVASLLEVGTGFHPELTGRENVYLNGAILGMRKAEVTRNLDAIVDFSEVGKFIDTPVKRYSSGMYVRLAFAVAAHLEPEILLVDEVLAVGDLGFQRKCLGRMDSVAKGGRTVLFVSHNMAAIQSLCQRVIMLEAGRVACDADTATTVGAYVAAVEKLVGERTLGARDDRRGGTAFRFQNVVFRDGETGAPLNVVVSGRPVRIEVEYENLTGETMRDVTVGLSFTNLSGAFLSACRSDAVGCSFRVPPGRGRVVCSLPRFPFSQGRFHYNVIADRQNVIVDWVKEAGFVDVAAGDYYGTGKMPASAQQSVLVDYAWGQA